MPNMKRLVNKNHKTGNWDNSPITSAAENIQRALESGFTFVANQKSTRAKVRMAMVKSVDGKVRFSAYVESDKRMQVIGDATPVNVVRDNSITGKTQVDTFLQIDWTEG